VFSKHVADMLRSAEEAYKDCVIITLYTCIEHGIAHMNKCTSVISVSCEVD
jgi:hypothetical protein